MQLHDSIPSAARPLAAFALASLLLGSTAFADRDDDLPGDPGERIEIERDGDDGDDGGEEEKGFGLGVGTIFRSLDNDTFAHSDDRYTHGLSFSFLSKTLSSFEDGPVPFGLGRAFDELPIFEGQDERVVAWSFSQRLFTPGDLDDPDLIENDIPYSALLYLTLSVSAQNEDVLDALSFDVGVTGPIALGEESQEFFHDLLDSAEPQGWDNQIENEPLFNARWEHRERLQTIGNPRSFNADLIGNVSAEVGNIQTRGSVGATARFGLRVPDNFHTPAPFLGDETVGLRSTTKREESFAIYGFASLGASVIGRAIYLDGNTFRDSHSVDYDRVVGRGTAGIVSHLGAVLLTLAIEKRTVPYDNPDGENSESYGRIGLTWDL